MQKLKILKISFISVSFLALTTAGVANAQNSYSYPNLNLKSCSLSKSISLSEINKITGETCKYDKTSLKLSDGRTFAIPDPGFGVSSHTLVTKDSKHVPEVNLIRTPKGDLAVKIDDNIFGNSSAKEFVSDIEIRQKQQYKSTAKPTASNKCAKPYYVYLGGKWIDTYRWKINETWGPGRGATDRIRAAADTWTANIYYCGKHSVAYATEQYQGKSGTAVGVTREGGCAAHGSESTIGYGVISYPPDVLGATCVHYFLHELLGIMAEADVKFNTLDSWYTGASESGCSGKWDLQGVATHEFGHVFGLDHVGQSTGQVMRPSSPPCDTGNRHLGLGDATGVKLLYSPIPPV